MIGGLFYQNDRIAKSLRAARWFITACTVLLYSGTGAAEEYGPAVLGAHYRHLKEEAGNNVFGLALRVSSKEYEDAVHGEIEGIFDQPFSRFTDALLQPRHWCDIVPLHTYIKACTYEGKADNAKLTLYIGRKFYQAPQDAFPLRYVYRVQQFTDDYIRVVLSAPDGPWGVRQNVIEVEALAVDGKTLLHFGIHYRASLPNRWATQTYLATLGRNKIGFSLLPQGSGLSHIPIKGVKGMIERNVMRYYLAIKTFMNTQDLPASERFEARIQQWFDATERYHEQLYEIPQQEYVEAKRQERINQTLMQEEIDVRNAQ